MPKFQVISGDDIQKILARDTKLSDQARALIEQITENVTPTQALVLEPEEGESLRQLHTTAQSARKQLGRQDLKVSKRGQRIIIHVSTEDGRALRRAK